MERFPRDHGQSHRVRPRASMVILITVALMMAMSAGAISRLGGVSQSGERRHGQQMSARVGSFARPYGPTGDDATGSPDSTVRFMTYNIHWGRGADGVHDLDRIADVLRRADADVVVLTEVDVNWRRSGNADQPAYLARAAGYPYWYFGRALTTWASGNSSPSEYGNLVLSRFPIVRAKTVPLPRPIGREPRSVAMVDVRIGNEFITVVGTHLGLNDKERMMQALHIRDLVESVSAQPPGRADHAPRNVILMGDFNARPSSPEITLLTGSPHGLVDTGLVRGNDHRMARDVPTNPDARDFSNDTATEPTRPSVFDIRPDGNTFPYPDPYARIDYIFVSTHLAGDVVLAGPLYVAGSDHLPVIADIAWPRQGSRGSATNR